MTISFIPNRMKGHWDEVKRFLKSEWPQLTDADWDEIDGEYDRLISRVCELYHPGAPIMFEAEVKGKIQRFLNKL